MDYDYLKECRNCGKYAISLSPIGYCSHCQGIEDYVPEFEYTLCPSCNILTIPFIDGDNWHCEWCHGDMDF